MKLGRKHLIASIVVLAASVAWNIWVFSKPAPRGSVSGASRLEQPPNSGPSTADGLVPSIDPATIAPPPPLDLTRAPAWARNPFAHPGAATAPGTSSPSPPAPAPVTAIPVLGAILFSDARKSAIIDGRIVGVGDRVQGGLVVSIARDAVVVELASGERIRLAGGAARGRSR